MGIARSCARLLALTPIGREVVDAGRAMIEIKIGGEDERSLF